MSVLPKYLTDSLKGLLVPIALCFAFAMLIIPMPSFMLDICFTLSIALALIVLLAAVYCRRPLDFAVFPSIVLFATLFRLILNVASTRIVLLNGHTGSGAAGQVIQAFAGIVIGNNYTVGLVIFLILVIVNFVVVTKGANRVSEVSARFMLDALPGKQLAIDADLNAGMIDQEEAKLRRSELSEETNFYGSMDGASKFVRGDAVACILILMVNVLGGVMIGTLQHQMTFAAAVERYFLLTVGDGLVAQIPALLISTATALIVTRSTQPQNFGRSMYQQVINQPRNLMIAGLVVGLLACFPGMPHIVFMGFALVLLASSYLLQREQNLIPVTDIPSPIKTAEFKPVAWQDIETTNGLEVYMGYGLLQDVIHNQHYLSKIHAIRQTLSRRYGFLIDAVKTKDNLALKPYQYQIAMNGCVMAEADVASAKSRVDVIVGHVQFVAQQHLSNLFNYQALAGYLEQIEESQPELYQALKSSELSNRIILKVLQNLLAEGVGIRASDLIFESMIDAVHTTSEPDKISEQVRKALGRHIVQSIQASTSELTIIRLEPGLEQKLLETIKPEDIPMQEREFQQIINRLVNDLAHHCQSKERMIVLVGASLRPILAQAIRQRGLMIAVIADDEMPMSFELSQHNIMELTTK